MLKNFDELDEAYRSTRYTVHSESDSLCIRVGERHPSVDALCASVLPSGTTQRWTIVTAYNPASHHLSAEDNAHRAERLRSDLDELATLLSDEHQRSLVVLPAVGTSPDGDWSEESVWVGGLTELEALALGARFGQNAVVTGAVGGAARVSWIVVKPTCHGIRSDHGHPGGGVDGSSAVGALRRIGDALSCGGPVDDGTLGEASLPWAQILDDAGEHPSAWAILDLEDLADDLECIPGVTEDCHSFNGSQVRVFSVLWSDGAALYVACEISGLGDPYQEAVAFGLDEDDALAALSAGTARLSVCQGDPDLDVSAEDLMECVDAL